MQPSVRLPWLLMVPEAQRRPILPIWVGSEFTPLRIRRSRLALTGGRVPSATDGLAGGPRTSSGWGVFLRLSPRESTRMSQKHF